MIRLLTTFFSIIGVLGQSAYAKVIDGFSGVQYAGEEPTIDEQGVWPTDYTRDALSSLSELGAIYLCESSDRVLINSKRLPFEFADLLFESEEVEFDHATGDFVFDRNFALMLASTGQFAELGTVDGFQISDKLTEELRNSVDPHLREDLLHYASANFFGEQDR